EGLADGLAAGDAERAVAIGVSAVGRLDEIFARDFLHGAQHGLIADPAPAQVELKHHLFRRIWCSGHRCLVSWKPQAATAGLDPTRGTGQMNRRWQDGRTIGSIKS